MIGIIGWLGMCIEMGSMEAFCWSVRLNFEMFLPEFRFRQRLSSCIRMVYLTENLGLGV